MTLAHLGRESLVTTGPCVIPPGVSRISRSPLVGQVEGEGRAGRELDPPGSRVALQEGRHCTGPLTSYQGHRAGCLPLLRFRL